MSDETKTISSAKLRYARISPQKARLVADLIRGKDVDEALRVLKFTRKRSAPIIGKLISSALANAGVNDPQVDVDELYVKTIFVDGGPTLRRFRPRALRRAIAHPVSRSATVSGAHGLRSRIGRRTGVALAAIAKGPERNAGLEPIFVPDKPAFSMHTRSPVLYFLQRLRDEAHRFAIGTHQARRSKRLRRSALDSGPGVGPRRKRALLNRFGSA